MTVMQKLYRRRSDSHLVSTKVSDNTEDETEPPPAIVISDLVVPSPPYSPGPSGRATALSSPGPESLKLPVPAPAAVAQHGERPASSSSKRLSMNLDIFSSLSRSLSDATRSKRFSFQPPKPEAPFDAKGGLAILPPEVLGRVLDVLADAGQGARLTKQTADVAHVCLTCRALEATARKHLYSILNLALDDLSPPAKTFFSRPKSRLKSLRYSLRTNARLAAYVQEIRIQDTSGSTDDGPQGSKTRNPTLLDQLASLVMACPNLERLTGILIPYEHHYTRLWHALSTRTQLREHLWHIGANTHISHHAQKGSGLALRYVPLTHAQINAFVQLHEQWSKLSTLALSSAGNGMFDHERLFIGVMESLPKLEHLSISHFDKRAIHDKHLEHLPRRLTSLRLENLEGVTEAGLLNHFTKTVSLRNRGNLLSLSLLDLDITDLSTIAVIFGHLYNLERFFLCAQTLFLDSNPAQILQPYFAARHLRFLHWSLSAAEEDAAATVDANALLAASIRAQGLPALRRLRVPTDPGGVLQSACKPLIRRAMIESPQTSPTMREPPRYRFMRREASPAALRRAHLVAAAASAPALDVPRPKRKSLLVARQQAQARAVKALRAQATPLMQVGAAAGSQRRVAKRASLRRPLPGIGEESGEEGEGRPLTGKTLDGESLPDELPEYWLEGEEDGAGGKGEGIVPVEGSVGGTGLGILF